MPRLNMEPEPDYRQAAAGPPDPPPTPVRPLGFPKPDWIAERKAQERRSPPAPPPPPPIRFEQPDWFEERRLAEERDRRAAAVPVRAEVPQAPEDEQPAPAKPKAKSATPNLDRWHAEMMRSDTRGQAA